MIPTLYIERGSFSNVLALEHGEFGLLLEYTASGTLPTLGSRSLLQTFTPVIILGVFQGHLNILPVALYILELIL